MPEENRACDECEKTGQRCDECTEAVKRRRSLLNWSGMFRSEAKNAMVGTFGAQ